jgi:hypothetical protein
MKIKLLIGIGILAVIVFFAATGSFNFTAQNGSNKAALPEGWTRYTSGELGYVVSYPEGWNVQENSGGSRDVLLTAPRGAAFVRIAGFNDPSINSIEAIKASIAEYKASFATKPNELLKEFESDTQGAIGGFGASGRMQINGAIYQFLERGLLSTNGRVLIMRGAVNTTETAMTQQEFDAQVKIIKQIMDSFSV